MIIKTVFLFLLLTLVTMAVAQVPVTEDFEQEPYHWIPNGGAQVSTAQAHSGNHSVWFSDSSNGSLSSSVPVFLSSMSNTLEFWILKPMDGTGVFTVEYSNGSTWTLYYEGLIDHPGPIWGRYVVSRAPLTDFYQVRISIQAGSREEEYYIDDITFTPEPLLPVELSSFTVTESSTNQALLTWVTQSETNVAGFNIYRGTSKDLSQALLLEHFIEGTNTTVQQTYVFLDTEIWESGTYFYWLESRDFSGFNTIYGPVSVVLDIDGQDIPPITPDFGITTVFPNPFNPSTNIQYYVSEAGYATLDVFDLRGQQIKRLYAGQREPGTYNQVWDGSDRNGNYLSTGVYCLRLSVGGSVALRKVMIMK